MILEYKEIYNLIIKSEKAKGIYLGQTAPGKRLRLNHVMLVNKGIGDLSKFPYCITRFKNYKFDEQYNLILLKTTSLIPQNNERGYLEELLKKIE